MNNLHSHRDSQSTAELDSSTFFSITIVCCSDDSCFVGNNLIGIDFPDYATLPLQVSCNFLSQSW
ncbi:hypothetical protein C8R42DRAFT_404440 [Lentinula raphanica]|nr:hypothetical protein C8R42DRAFT_404440 [Lentinula raphanica]